MFLFTSKQTSARSYECAAAASEVRIRPAALVIDDEGNDSRRNHRPRCRLRVELLRVVFEQARQDIPCPIFDPVRESGIDDGDHVLSRQWYSGPDIYVRASSTRVRPLDGPSMVLSIDDDRRPRSWGFMSVRGAVCSRRTCHTYDPRRPGFAAYRGGLFKRTACCV